MITLFNDIIACLSKNLAHFFTVYYFPHLRTVIKYIHEGWRKLVMFELDSSLASKLLLLCALEVIRKSNLSVDSPGGRWSAQ